MMQIESYLFYSGNCEEALTFYQHSLGGEIVTLMRYQGSPMDNAQLPLEWKHKVMHAVFECEGARFMASDMPPSEPAPRYNGFSMALHVTDADKARRAFEALSVGGKVRMPFAPPFWGGHFGQLTDKFGVPWMVTSEH